MAQSNHDLPDLIDFSDVLKAIAVAKEQLNEDLMNIIQNIKEDSGTGLLKADKFEDKINFTLNNEFGGISTFLEHIFQDITAQAEERNRDLISRIESLESQLLKTENDREQFVQEAADLRQKTDLYQKKLLEVTNTMHSLAKRVKQLELIQKDYERTRYRLQRIFESSNDEIVSQQVERMINLLIKAVNRILEAQKGRSPMKDESYRLQKTYDAVKVLSEHDRTSRMILVLAEKGEIEVNHLAEITGQNRFILKYRLKKWIRNGLIRTESNGRIIKLAALQD
ncbi:MAG: hypothetical protein ACFFB3_23290 [Candidatus Hodarchaeota archaeon]